MIFRPFKCSILGQFSTPSMVGLLQHSLPPVFTDSLCPIRIEYTTSKPEFLIKRKEVGLAFLLIPYILKFSRPSM